VLDRVVDDRVTILVRRKGARDVALIPADDLSGLLETAHLLRSPRNATRLLTALRRSERGRKMPASPEALRRKISDVG
jgi:antitoxin YefM